MNPPWPDGIHLTADLAGCQADHPWMRDVAALRQACLDAARAAGLTVVGERFHHFASMQGDDAGAASAQPPSSSQARMPSAHTAQAQAASSPPQGGITGVLLLAESHLAVHTWPEHGVVTLDVFVCNMLGDNTQRARHLLDALITGWAPARQSVQAIRRCIPAADKT